MVMFKLGIALTLLLFISMWIYMAFIPPPPKICGTPGGPPVTGPRITLRDGRHLSYQEYGVPKEKAKYKIISIHGHGTNKKDPYLQTSDLVEEFQMCIVAFDRPGYGESDPDPKRTIKSTVLDIEELADQLGLGPKIYIVGYSAGGPIAWGCLKYIPHRLAGATLISPGFNYWWPSLPANLVSGAFKQTDPWTAWDFRIAHYVPWLLYWWNTQNTQDLFPPTIQNFNAKKNLELPSDSEELQEYSTQQGLYESYLRDAMVTFGKVEFDPMDLEDPFAGVDDSVVHLWQGDKDEGVPVAVQRFIVEKLSWIYYHEVPNGTHVFSYEDNMKGMILTALVMGDKYLS